LYDGREWRTHYWQLKKNTILKYAKKENKAYRTTLYDGKQPIVEIIDDNVYDNLTEDIWTTRKLDQ
jgi:hypothetical protein